MATMGAACIASAGVGHAHRHGGLDDDVPDRAGLLHASPRRAAASRTPPARSASARPLDQVLLHYLFIYKAKARPGWYLIPE